MGKAKKCKLKGFDKIKRPRVRVLLEEFDGDAQNWGYQQDQGWGQSVDNSEEAYLEAKHRLVVYLNRVLKKGGAL